MAKKTARGEGLGINLTPLVDCSFMLLLFMVIGADMSVKQVEMISLPYVPDVKEEKKDEEELIINIVHVYPACSAFQSNTQVCENLQHWNYSLAGCKYKVENIGMMEGKIKAYAQVHKQSKESSISEAAVLIRADKRTPYILVQQAYQLVAKQGIYKVKVGTTGEQPK